MKLRFSLRSALVATSIVAGLITYFDSDAIFFKPVNHLSWIRSAEPVYFGLRQPRFSTQPVRLDYVVFTNQKLTIDEIEQITGRYPPRQICSVMGGTLRKPEGRVSLDDLTTYLELAGDEPNADALLRLPTVCRSGRQRASTSAWPRERPLTIRQPIRCRTAQMKTF